MQQSVALLLWSPKQAIFPRNSIKTDKVPDSQKDLGLTLQVHKFVLSMPAIIYSHAKDGDKERADFYGVFHDPLRA